jgi:preprotein translocase subunit SecD
MNRYPLWKYILILIVILIGTLYAAPNLYTDDPSVQIAGGRNVSVTDATLQTIETTLKDGGIAYKSAVIDPTGIVIRFASDKEQLAARDLIRASLGDDYVVALSFSRTTPSWLTAFNAKPMYLGLDLRGGLHFLIEIDMETAFRQELERYKNDFFDYFKNNKDKKLRARSMIIKDEAIELKYKGEEKREQVKNVLRSNFPELEFGTLERGDSFYVEARLSKQKIEEHRSNTISQIINVLKKRIDDKYQGLMEPVIVRQGDNRIVAEFPGVQNSEELISILSATASLEFRMEQDRYTVKEAQEGRAPGSKLYTMRETGEPVLLKNNIIITGKEITHATATSDENGLPAVSVQLDGPGSRKMGDTTKQYLGKPMAVVFIEYETKTIEKDGKLETVSRPIEEVISLATIRGVFSKRFQITGLDRDEATKLALLLRAGALAAPIQIVEERTVGPALGKENIEKGINSVIIGFVCVVAFMIFWYRGFGLVANVALFMNLVLIVAVLSMFQATLTLPGIAGIVLTVGMAVDANVLIFQRIREELSVGNTPQASINSGYGKAYSTILDANVTTLIAALVLFIFGTGPVKGFATTLSIGIATSMFTAILGTRAIVNLTVGGKKINKLSI